MLSRDERKSALTDWRNLHELKRSLRGSYRKEQAGRGGQRGCFLIFGGFTVRNVIAHLPVIMAAQRAGYEIRVLLPTENDLVAEAYSLCGARHSVFLADFLADGPHPLTEKVRGSFASAKALKEFTYKGCRVGKFCVSTLMRWSRLGDPDINEAETDARLRQQLEKSLHAADAAEAIVKAINPDIALMNERSYSPFGEIFDTVLNNGGRCIVWTAGHRNDMLILKRYSPANVIENHFSLSGSSWERIRTMPWSERQWHRVRDEIVQSYGSGEWFSECATQLDKTDLDRFALIARLGLDLSLKTVCVFPHMFWDATFFWGEDLFENYEQWFVEVLKIARDNPCVNWIVKIHPANVAKAIRDGFRGEHSEIVAIKRTLGSLPPHIKLIPPDSDISTLSLLNIVDYCLTVRGTIGIEASAFGIRVLTAGTGRYDRRGFTMDFDGTGEYLDALRRLPELAPMNDHEIELARRFAYGTFIMRPTLLYSTTLRYRRELAAQLETQLVCDGPLLDAPDVRSIADWLASGDDDYLATANNVADVSAKASEPSSPAFKSTAI